jgi:hypothetical protein
MELRDAILLLEYYNRWRRGEDESLDMPNPREIGIALDTVLAAVTEGGTGNSGVERPEPSPHFLQKGTPETDALAHSGLCPVSYIARMTDLARKLERERDEARQQEQIHYDNLHEARSLAQAGYAKAERAEKMLIHAAAWAHQWRECAEKLESFVYTPFAADEHAACAAALAEFKRLKEASK